MQAPDFYGQVRSLTVYDPLAEFLSAAEVFPVRAVLQ